MSDVGSKSMHWADYLLLVLLFAASVAIGLFQARGRGCGRGRSTSMSRDEYFLGSQQLRIVPVAFSVVASFLSAVLIVGGAADVYLYGARTLLVCLSVVIAPVFSAYTIVPVLYPLKLTSAYEYLELRFQARSVRLLGTALSTINMVFYSGVVALAPSIALAGVSPIPVWLSNTLLVTIATIYTILGGIKAVVWTDVFQVLVMFAGILAILIKGTTEIGLQNFTIINTEGGRFDFSRLLSMDHNEPFSILSTLVGSLIVFTGYIGYHQNSVQRFSSLPTMQKAQRSMLLTGLVFPIVVVFAMVVGLVIYAHNQSIGCDPLKAGFIKSPNQYVPYYVLHNFSAVYGFLGLFIAAMLSAALSTLSSNINSLTALSWADILKVHLENRLSDHSVNWIIKLLGVVYGTLIIVISVILSNVKGSLFQLAISIVGAVNCPLLGLYYLGSIFPWMNWIGAFVGTLSGFGINVWISVGKAFLPPGHALTLPSASTENCTYSNSSHTIVANESLITPYDFYINRSAATTQSVIISGDYTNSTSSVLSGVQQIYQISYLFIGPVGLVVQLIVANLVCFISGYTNPHSVDRNLLLWSPRLLFCKKRKFHRVPKNDKEMEMPVKKQSGNCTTENLMA